MAFAVKGTLTVVTPTRVTVRFLDDAGPATMLSKCGADGIIPYNERHFWASVPARMGVEGLIAGVDYKVTLTARRYRFRSTRPENLGEEIIGAKLTVQNMERVVVKDADDQ